MYNISCEEIINLAAQAGARMALETFEKTKKVEKQKRSDLRLHRTDLLLKSYRTLSQHCENAIFEKRKIKLSAVDILDDIDDFIDDGMYIESIKKSAQRTTIIVKHVKKMIEIFKIISDNSKEIVKIRRYNALYMKYIDPTMPTMQRITEVLQIERSLVYDDINIAMQDLTPLFFGIDGLKIK
jgi:hypothetical protein